MITLDIYACCRNKFNGSLTFKFETKNHYHNFLGMTLYRFAKLFYAKKNEKQLIKKNQTNKLAMTFNPTIFSREDNENYRQFCKYSFIRFCHYVDCIENECDKLNENSELKKKLWETY